MNNKKYIQILLCVRVSLDLSWLPEEVEKSVYFLCDEFKDIDKFKQILVKISIIFGSRILAIAGAARLPVMADFRKNPGKYFKYPWFFNFLSGIANIDGVTPTPVK